MCIKYSWTEKRVYFIYNGEVHILITDSINPLLDIFKSYQIWQYLNYTLFPIVMIYLFPHSDMLIKCYNYFRILIYL